MVHIVVLNWNGISDTEACVRSILRSGRKDCIVHVVDNDSSNDEFAKLGALFQGDHDYVRVYQSGDNRWFSGWNNFGLAQVLTWPWLSEDDLVLFLNNDTEVDENFLDPLIESFASHPDAGAVQSLVVFHECPERINNAWLTYAKNALAFELGRNQPVDTFLSKQTTNAIPLATGCAMAIPIRIVRELLLDEASTELWNTSYFLYNEDVALSIRIRQRGYGIYRANGSIVRHKVSVSTKKIGELALFHSYKNVMQTYLTHFEAGELLRLSPFILAMEAVSVVYVILTGRFRVWLRAKIWIIRNAREIRLQRAKILSLKKTSIVHTFVNRWRNET